MGSAWKQLPDDLSDPARRLTEELRAVKDATGLSLSELAALTHYSRASWERWLNGKRVITEQALDALVGAVDCDGPKLRALWELTAAEAAAVDAAAGSEAAAEPEGSDRAPGTDGGPATGAEATAAGEAGPAGTADGPDAAATTATTETADATGAAATDGSSAEGTLDDGTGADAPAVDGPGALATVPGTDRAVRTTGRPSGPVLGRPVALIAASVVVVLLLALAGVRYFSDTDGDNVGPTAATVLTSTPATPVDSASPSTTAPAVPANPAPAVPACQALGCAHKDPKAAGCGGDARTLLTTNIGKVVIYLRYSQKCQAAWAAITEGQPGDQATITTTGGESETALIHWGYDNYSQMVNAGDPAATLQVCGTRAQPEGAACTASVSDLARVVANTPIPVGPASPPAAATDAAPSPTPAG
ncbi:DUF2690 domain-containing protein [Kitasatospora sp. NPDC094019]|uniref:helix-turn-helix domain-containing protein n=1 Tax=Kitasatospora sp. NPDC094019 TaxID=3364091 RepID=UPI0037F6398E